MFKTLHYFSTHFHTIPIMNVITFSNTRALSWTYNVKKISEEQYIQNLNCPIRRFYFINTFIVNVYEHVYKHIYIF